MHRHRAAQHELARRATSPWPLLLLAVLALLASWQGTACVGADDGPAEVRRVDAGAAGETADLGEAPDDDLGPQGDARPPTDGGGASGADLSDRPRGDLGADSGEAADGDGDAALESRDSAVASDGGAVDDAQQPDPDPWVEILHPTEGSEVSNPVWFQFEASEDVVTVAFHCDDWPLQDAPIPAAGGEHTYDFVGVNRARTVILTGYDAAGAAVATASVTFVPSQPPFDCTTWPDTGYVSGDPFQIELVRVLDKPVELRTANAFWLMREAALTEGVDIRIVSGFRTNAEQRYLYNCYINCNCNNCNLAARPGYSNHQSGHALDLNTSTGAGVLRWLNRRGDDFGFERTVPSEDWHWEWWGGGPGGGPCPE